ncbi:hypothetical protein FS837_004145 [Tulasnella sp. UAMH 9824]|nr:hypothetical protein FS837_004145 [Tulasnella sp. UAMH 9824]
MLSVSNAPMAGQPASPSKPRYQMLLHNMQMQGKVFYMESAVADGPRHRETWTASVFLLDQPGGNVVGTFIGGANTRQAAREEASRKALAALGYY